MKTIHGTITLPSCWKKLIDISFDDLVGGDEVDLEKTGADDMHPLFEDVKDGKSRTALDDPEPYYDDSREIHGVFENGDVAIVYLASGQSNYYGGIAIESKEFKDILQQTEEGEPMESYPDVIEVDVPEGPMKDWEPRHYELTVTWVEKLN